MSRKQKFLLIFSILGCLTCLLGQAIMGYQDWLLRSAPGSNPQSGYLRMWADSGSNLFKCITSSGATCYFNSTSGISLTTTGTSGASTLIGGVLNIPVYGGGTTIWTGSGNPNGASSIISSTSVGSYPGVSSITTPAINTSIANTIVAVVGGTAYGSFSDNKSNTWTRVQQGNANGDFVQGYYCSSCTVGSGHTFTYSGATNYATISVVSMIALSYDKSTISTGSLSGSSLTPTNPGELILAGAGAQFNGSGFASVASPFTIVTSNTTCPGIYAIALSDATDASTSPINSTWTAATGCGTGGGVGAIIQFAFNVSSNFTSGVAGDFYYETSTGQLYGPRPTGTNPFWPSATVLQYSGFGSGGTTFTASGCSAATLLGGATAGSYHSGTTGTCTVTVTMGDGATASNGWACAANDLTTTTDTIKQTASSTTTATLAGTTVSGDIINFQCSAF